MQLPGPYSPRRTPRAVCPAAAARADTFRYRPDTFRFRSRPPEHARMQTRDGEPDRWIALPGTLNLRDLGGYPAAGGGTVRWRTLLRSDALHRLDDAGRAALAGLDLRTDEEVTAAPSALDSTGARTLHVPMFSDEAIRRLPPELAAIYRYMID